MWLNIILIVGYSLVIADIIYLQIKLYKTRKIKYTPFIDIRLYKLCHKECCGTKCYTEKCQKK